MRVRFWGVRGAVAATDPDAQGVGGNTPCVEVRDDAGNLLVLDAGIGIYWLGRSLLAGPLGRGQGEVTLLLSHTHWDHIQGIPFFVPAFIPGNRMQVWGAGSGAQPACATPGGPPCSDLTEVLERQMDPVYSPICSLSNFGATLSIHEVSEQPRFEVGRLTVSHGPVQNGDYRCVGYRIEEQGGRSFCYVAEVEHRDGGFDPTVLELARGADLLVHEAYYTNEERARGSGVLTPGAPGASGHSCYAQATDLALAAGARRLRYFYHHPNHSDRVIAAAVEGERRRIAALGRALDADAAREGVELEV